MATSIDLLVLPNSSTCLNTSLHILNSPVVHQVRSTELRILSTLIRDGIRAHRESLSSIASPLVFSLLHRRIRTGPPLVPQHFLDLIPKPRLLGLFIIDETILDFELAHRPEVIPPPFGILLGRISHIID